MLGKESTMILRQMCWNQFSRHMSTQNHRRLSIFHLPSCTSCHHGYASLHHGCARQNHGSVDQNHATQNLTMSDASVTILPWSLPLESSPLNYNRSRVIFKTIDTSSLVMCKLVQTNDVNQESCKNPERTFLPKPTSASYNSHCHGIDLTEMNRGKQTNQGLSKRSQLPSQKFVRNYTSLASIHGNGCIGTNNSLRNGIHAITNQESQTQMRVSARYYTTGPSGNHDNPTDPDSDAFNSYLKHLLMKYSIISRRLQADDDLSEGERYNLRQQELEMRFLVKQIELLDEKRKEFEELQQLAKGGESKEDQEMQVLALEEVDTCQESIKEMQEEIISLLTPPAPSDENDILLELSAGVGGQEAMLFTSDMFDMYQQFAVYKRWKFDVVDYQNTDIGGLRSAIVSICGHQVNQYMKYEGGIHRVQRVPKTESRGRMHTSTMTVAIMPQPKEIEIHIDKKDLHIETMKASGAGGQHVNTTDSAVRISHIPSGIVVECQKERSQIKNKSYALKILAARLYNQQLQRHLGAERSRRKEQIGMAERADKIRTYNFNANRVTDHRSGMTVHDIEGFMSDGEKLNELMESLMEEDQRVRLRDLIEEHIESTTR